jgi:hypothetical protein
MAAPTASITPNLFQLQGGGIHISYASTGIAGKPTFSYQDVHVSKSFNGDEIDVAETPIGRLVTVILRLTVDLGSTSFSVLIPTVNLASATDHAYIHTEGITTVHRFSIAPSTLRGQTELYHFTPMSGTAQHVEL